MQGANPCPAREYDWVCNNCVINEEGRMRKIILDLCGGTGAWSIGTA